MIKSFLQVSLLVFLTIPSALCQSVFYVSPTGLNSQNGSFAFPWQTIQYGSDQLTPGDTLLIRGGSYSEKIDLSVSGAVGQMTTIRNYQSETVLIDAAAFSDENPIFYAHNKSYYRIQGIHFTNCYSTNGAGFYVDGFGDSIELLDCIFSNISISTNPNTPVNTNTNQPTISFIGESATDSLSNILVSGIEVFNCRPGYSECLTISGNATDFIFINNYIHDNKNIAIDATGNYQVCPDPALDQARRGLIKNNICHDNIADYATASGVYVDGGRDIIIENNETYKNGFGIDVGCEEPGTTSNVIVRNNLIYQNKIAGIQLGGYDPGTSGTVLNCLIANNTFFKNDVDQDGNGSILFSQFENSSIINNIFYLNAQDYWFSEEQSQPGLIMDYNVIYNNGGSQNITAYYNNQDITGLANIYSTLSIGANDTNADPLFVNSTNSNLDLHLQSSSLAIDAGDPAYVPDPSELDIDGETRISNTAVDCGADEYHLVSNAQVLLSDLDITLFPNPSTTQLMVDGDLQFYNIRVLNSSGTEVANYTGTTGPLTIDLTGLSSGMFFLVLEHMTNGELSVFTNIKY